MQTTRSVWITVFGCSGFMIGLALVYFGFVVSTLVIALITVVMVIKFRQTAILYLLILLLGYNIGYVRGQPYMDDILMFKSLIGQKVEVTGIVAEDLTYHESGQREFHINTKDGRLRVRSFRANNLYRGDKVLVSGKVYRALGNRHGSIQYAQVQRLAKSDSWLEALRIKFFASTQSVLPDEQSALGLGFLVGVANMLPDDLNENLRTVGLTHIVAVSGYNLTILVLLTRRLLVGSSKFVATVAAVLLLVVFLSLTGGAPSIVRASVVSGLTLLAWYYGRNINALVLLLISAAISAYINPYYLWKDIGWWLSFTAFFGVLVLAPLITKRYFKEQPKLVGQVLIETTCAQILTFPIIAYIFGDVSVIALLANLLVLPFVPIAMLATFVVGAMNMVLPSLVGALIIPTNYILGYIIGVTNLLATVPSAVVKLNISLTQLFLSYSLIIFICVVLYAKKSRDKLY